MVELFFDLVFVFAVTQLSHGLLHHLYWMGAAQTAILMVGVWTAWVYTSWVTNWLDPERLPVRLTLFALLAAGLVMSAAIPESFGTKGLIFALAYVFIQVGRTVFFLWSSRGEVAGLIRNFQRVMVWLSAAGLLWLFGGLVELEVRIWWWTAAMAVEFLSPMAYFWLCCTNPVRDSSCESSVVAGWHEQTDAPDLQDPELASLQRCAQAPGLADDLVRSRHDLGCRADRQAWPPARLQ